MKDFLVGNDKKNSLTLYLYIMPRRKTKEQFVSQCRELWGDRFNCDKVEYVNQAA